MDQRVHIKHAELVACLIHPPNSQKYDSYLMRTEKVLYNPGPMTRTCADSSCCCHRGAQSLICLHTAHCAESAHAHSLAALPKPRPPPQSLCVLQRTPCGEPCPAAPPRGPC